MKREGMLKRIIWILGAILILLSLVVLSSSTQLKKFSTPKFIDAYTQVSNGENATATPYVTFDACFEQSGVKYRGIHAELNNTVNLAINLNVQTNGTLKNGKITFDDDRNYTLINNINTDDYIKSVTSSSITFSDIPLGVNKTINATLKQTPCNINNFDYELNNLSKTNKLTFTGTHVASDGTETKISKDVYFHIDWYGDIQVIRYSDDYTQNKFILSEEEGKIYIVYTSYVYTNDVTNLKASALDKAAIFETVIPQMQGYNPIDVYVEDIGEINRTLTYDYNPTTRVLTSRMEAVIGEDGLGDIVIYGNSYRQNIVIVYPKEAYTASATGTLLNADSKVYAEGYSTDSNGNLITVTSEPLENKLQVYLSNPQGEVYKFQSKFTDACLTKTNMRVNYKENKDIRNGYIVDWHFNLALLKNFESVIFEEDYSNSPDAQTSSYIEDTDHFVSTAGTNYDLDGITYYDAIRVLPTTFNILGEDGYVKVFNAETNQLVKQLTAVDAGEIIAYDTDVEHIRIETSAPITTGTISIENYKVLDNQKMMAAYNLATFETFETLKSSMKGSVKYADREDVTVVNGDIASTEYLEGSSLFEASLASNAFYPQKLNTNTVNINFRLPSEDFRDRDFVVWESPTIIVEFPEEFERIIYNSFSIEELDEVTITSVNIEEINGKQVLKICTDGLITENDSFKLNYQAEIDEFTTATQGNIRVFASNKITAATRWYFSTTTDEIDIYDVDGDGDITEEVPVENNTSYYAQVNQLVTTTQITNFDNKGTIVEGPNVAKVDKNVTDSARINILVSNGYTDIISNIKIVGRIPFENNKYVINEKNIGSQYSTTLKNTGIRSADGLTNYTVYYSENETATKDLTNSANGWTTNPSDWSNIKSYMIDFGTATLPGKTSYKFYYDVNVPSGLEYGKVTYGTHAIYFDSAIATGLSTETDKVGLMFAAEKQYKLQVNSYKYNTNELICSSSDDKYYSYAWIYIKGEGKGDYTTGFSSSYYSANISELNPGVVYTIKQKSLTGHYLKSDEEISFIVNPVDGNLQLEILSGNPRGTAVFEDNTAKIDFENVFKYNVEIRNKYKGTNNLIKNSTFKLNGPKNNNWVDANGNSTDGSAKSSTGVFTWKKMSVDTVTLEQVDVTDPQILKITDPMNITISLAENNEYVYSDLVNLTPDQIEYINTYTDPPKFSISVYNEYKDATVNVHHYLKDTTTSISESVVINGKINDSYTTTAATDIDTKRYKLVSTSGNTSGIMESETTDVIYYYEEQYHNYTVEYYYDNVIDSTKTETLSAPYGVYVYSYPSKKIDGYELEKADGLPLQISDNETQNKIQVYYVTKGTLPVSVEKTATWVDVKEGIARIDITDIGGSGTEPMDVMLVVDASYSMIFNQYENYGSSSPCLNAAHWTTGTHVNDAGSDAEAVANGCIERFTVVKNVLNTFITDFMSKNSENRMAITSFSWQGKDELTFTNDETAIHSTITNLEAHGLQYNVLGGTYYETGFEKAYAQIQNRNTNESGDSSINSRKTVLVFLTDGSPTNTSSGGTGGWLGGFGQSGNSVSAEEYAELLKNMGVQIYTNGIGINETDDAAACELLRGISSDGTTDFAITDTAEGLAEIYDNISNDIYFAGENARIVDTINSNWIYYEDDTHKPNPSENMTVNGQVVTWNQGTIAGESTFSFFIRLRDNEAQQYADGTWDTNNSLVLTYTDPLGATKSIESENPNLTRKQVTINFYKEGTTEKIKESVYNKGHVIGDMVSHYIAPAMGVNTGYTLVSERSQSIIVSEGINEINYYYAPRTDLSYTVEYYINGTKDDTLTETVTGQTYESTISSHSFKTIPGYRLARTENYPLTIGLSDNVIKAYYEVDTDQRKDIVYVIWFYKDGNYIVEDSISGRANVQYLEHFGEVNKEGIDIVNKYTGYKPVKVEVEGDYILNGEEHRFDDITHISEIDVLPDAVANTSIITVFYEKDDNQRKDLNYTIEYYKDGALADTEPQKANIQVLEDSITIPAGTINTTDKYEGYVFDSETTGTVPTIAKDGDVIKIYYKARTDLTYRVEYIFNNNTDSNLTDTFTATYGEVINTFVDKIKPGYKFSSATVPITIGLGENIIEVNYVTDPEQKKSVNYKIEYYKDEVHVDADDRVIYEYVQYLDTDDIFVDPDEINRSNKYIGYSYVKTIIEPEVPDSYPMFDEELPDVVPSGSIIKVYYASNLYEYRVGYYYDGIIDDSKTERYTARYGTSIGTYVDKVIDGYVFQKTGPLPITITENEEDNFIEVFYVKRTDLSYNVKYLEQGTNAELAPEKVVANQRFGDTITENALDIDGYVKTSESESIEITTGTNEIIFYYTKRNDLSYKVEYYLNGTKDDSLTEEITGQIYGSTISTHTFKTIEGYKLENIENYPITIGTSDNIIKAYYVIDDSQTKELQYTVEYYLNNVQVTADTHTETQIVHILDDEYIDVDENIVNIRDKYYGYKFSHLYVYFGVPVTRAPEPNPTLLTELPLEVSTGSCLRIYYVTDETVTKDVSYTLEYYKDNVLVAEDTEIFTQKVPYVQNYNWITIQKDAINITDKYDGYKYVNLYVSGPNGPEIDGEEKPVIPDSILEGEKIKVYYEKDNFEYSIEYYYDGVKDDSKTEKGTAVFESKINTYSDKVMPGYKLEKVEGNPITITSNQDKNVMKVYYVTDDSQKKTLSYKVEYYKEGDLAAEETFNEEVQLLKEDVLTVNKAAINTTNKFTGYRFVSTEPETIPDRIANGSTIKVNYERDDFEYRVEYFYDGVRDDSKTDTFTVKYGYVVNSYQDKNIDGYVLNVTSPFPFDVTENEERNVLEVYYEKDKFDYTIEYYYDGIRDDSKTETGTEVFQKEINTYPDKVVDGYVLEKVEGNPITITSNRDNNVMKVFYIKRSDLAYTVKYLEQGTNAEIAPNKVVTNKLFGEKITENAIDIDGYNKVNPTTQEITMTTGTNEIVFYYTKRTDLSYRVEYYYNDSINNDYTETITATYLDVIENYTDKVKTGYKFDRVEGIPLTISTNTENNVIRVYYVTDETQTKTLRYQVRYYKDNIEVEEDSFSVTEDVQWLQSDIMTVRKDGINIVNKYDGYKFEKILLQERVKATPTTELTELPDTVESVAIIEVYYIKDSFEYSIEYYYDAAKDESKTEVGTAIFESKIDTYQDKIIDGYVLEKVEGNPITITSNRDNNVMKIFYIKRNDLAYTVKYLEQGTNQELAPEKVVTNQTFQDIITENAIDIDGYNKVNRQENITITTGTNEIIFYYTKRTDLNYRVEYYFDEEIDNSLTETITATYLDVIENYTDKVKPGYKYESDTAPITIGTGENVIRVYYVIDDSQTKELSYTVEYYKDGDKVDEEVEKTTVQLLAPDTMPVDKTKINLVDKYVGYKLDAATETIPDTVTSGQIIKVYYIIDDGNTKDLKYTVEYYKDGEKQVGDTQEVGATVQILKPDTLTVQKDKINTTDKYNGYKFVGTEPNPIPDTIENNGVIKVYYEKDQFEYKVEYYYDANIDNSKTEIFEATYQDVISTYTDKVIDGYKLDEVVGLPLTIDYVEENNVIKVYYEKDIFSYSIEYYYNGEKDDVATEYYSATFGDEITEYTNKVKPGYKFSNTENNPMIITSNETLNVMKVYYEIDDAQRKDISYKVEYYKDGTKADENTVTENVQLLAQEILTVKKDEINVTDKYDGYKFVGTEPEAIPDTVTNGDIIKVNYEKDTFGYTVEYYFEGVRDDAKTESLNALFGEKITTYPDKVEVGYKLDRVDGTPLTITSNPTNNIIQVYYVIDDSQTKELSLK